MRPRTRTQIQTKGDKMKRPPFLPPSPAFKYIVTQLGPELIPVEPRMEAPPPTRAHAGKMALHSEQSTRVPGNPQAAYHTRRLKMSQPPSIQRCPLSSCGPHTDLVCVFCRTRQEPSTIPLCNAPASPAPSITPLSRPMQ